MIYVPYEMRPYRPCVGIMLVNKQGGIFVGQRIDAKGDAWQMPQGGMEEGETPHQAAVRELWEETGCESVRYITELDAWLSYDVPPALADRIWDAKYRGQTQKWVALLFEGEESEINLGAHTPEFSAWRWAKKEELAHLAISFKRDVYKSVVHQLWPRVEAALAGASTPQETP
ncbi:MAG: RNA pyrophosphohydrolase [Candidatus Puniceispirillum sp.]|nr:RNA pyrophosphohydrolase [Candidatus Puniceispirillum sp.]